MCKNQYTGSAPMYQQRVTVFVLLVRWYKKTKKVSKVLSVSALLYIGLTHHLLTIVEIFVYHFLNVLGDVLIGEFPFLLLIFLVTVKKLEDIFK